MGTVRQHGLLQSKPNSMDAALQSVLTQGQKLPDLREEILRELQKKARTIVILDDDPTGTQTVHDVPVLTSWKEVVLENEIRTSATFFILTNSRSLQIEEADELLLLIGQRLHKIAAKLQKHLIVISRSDSTLRGHYPNEVNALKKGLGLPGAKDVLIPAFFEGGRYTYGDIHYVQQGASFIPAAQTPFAEDKTFGYRSSNLKDWIVEKTKGRTQKTDIASISIAALRDSQNDWQHTLEENKTHYIVNATGPHDLQKLALGFLQQEDPYIFRTAASFVNAISGILPKKIVVSRLWPQTRSSQGGLTVIGSYVPNTTAQFEYLRAQDTQLHFLEFTVDHLESERLFLSQIEDLSNEIDELIQNGLNVVLFTSRRLKVGKTKQESLRIVNRVSSGLVRTVQLLTCHPKYIVAKGGITSSDIAVKGLGVKKAVVMGQVLDGVPLWRLDSESKFPDLPYVVFPGNVGAENALHELIQELK